jgi:hypothetical protein
MDGDTVPEFEVGLFDADPKRPPALGAEEVVLLAAAPKRPPELGAEVVALPLPILPRLHDAPPEVVGVFDPKAPLGAPDVPPNRDVLAAGAALPDEVVAVGVPALLAFALPKIDPAPLFPVDANGLGVLLPLPGLLPNKPPPPPLVAAKGFGDAPLPAPDVAIPPNKLPAPLVVFPAVPNKLPLPVPLLPLCPEPGCPKLNFPAISPSLFASRFASIPLTSSRQVVCLLALSQSSQA